MNYCSRETFTSETHPDVSFTIKKMNEKRRVARELILSGIRYRLQEQSNDLEEALKVPEAQPPGAIDKMNAAWNSLLEEEWYPAWIRWGLYSLEGFEMDGQKATVDAFIEDGPDDLKMEIFKAIQKASGLSVTEGESSPTPGTSGDPADGKTTSSTAESAEQPSGTEPAIAASISPAT